MFGETGEGDKGRGGFDLLCAPLAFGAATYVIEFKTVAGEALAISIPRTEAAVIRHFQARMPYSLIVPDAD